MRRHLQFPAAAAALLLATGAALPGASALANDARLVERAYAANEVVRIDGRTGVQATIGFAEDEQIENVAVGDSAKWQITPNKRANLLFVKPLEAGARTNMTVVTDRRTYFFDLVSGVRTQPIYLLRFRYPEEERLAAEKAKEERALALNEAEQSIIAGGAPAASTDPAMLNFAWARKGDAQLMPSRVYDDGENTYLLWPAERSVPAILIENGQGQEGPVNYAVRGNTIVLDEVPGLIVLRSGEARATLQNQRGAGTPRPASARPEPRGAEPLGAAAARSDRAHTDGALAMQQGN